MAESFKINVEFYEEGDYIRWEHKDLLDKDIYNLFFIAFGNGIIDEMRVVGETKAGIIAFCNMMETGGYHRAKNPVPKNVKLYKEGDVCYPEGSPFVFISPIAENGERVDFDNYDSEKNALIQSLEKEQKNSLTD